MIVCKPADPEAKGLVERAHGWLERSFLPGRTFAGPADFNAQLAMWLGLASTRPRRALGCAPAERIAADKAAMLALPPVAPQTGWRTLTRLARDHYVRLDSNDYSVHPAVIGRRIEVTADLARVRVAVRRPGRSRTMSGPGPAISPSPTRRTGPPRTRCAASGPRCCAVRPSLRCRSGRWPTTTRRSATGGGVA